MQDCGIPGLANKVRWMRRIAEVRPIPAVSARLSDFPKSSRSAQAAAMAMAIRGWEADSRLLGTNCGKPEVG